MLIRDFYKIIEFSFTENQVLARISLNSNHEVYEGHFPDQPVVPGVIQLQILKELTEKALMQKVTLTEMAFSKFLKMIIPGLSPDLSFSIELKTRNSDVLFSASIADKENIFTKAKGVFTLIPD